MVFQKIIHTFAWNNWKIQENGDIIDDSDYCRGDYGGDDDEKAGDGLSESARPAARADEDYIRDRAQGATGGTGCEKQGAGGKDCWPTAEES